MTILKQRLARRLRFEGASETSARALSLVDLTGVAERTITDDLEHLISLTVDPSQADYAVVTGVQIHSWGVQFDDASPNLEYVAPATVYTVINGHRSDIDLLSLPVRLRQGVGAASGRWFWRVGKWLLFARLGRSWASDMVVRRESSDPTLCRPSLPARRGCSLRAPACTRPARPSCPAWSPSVPPCTRPRCERSTRPTSTAPATPGVGAGTGCLGARRVPGVDAFDSCESGNRRLVLFLMPRCPIPRLFARPSLRMPPHPLQLGSGSARGRGAPGRHLPAAFLAGAAASQGSSPGPGRLLDRDRPGDEGLWRGGMKRVRSGRLYSSNGLQMLYKWHGHSRQGLPQPSRAARVRARGGGESSLAQSRMEAWRANKALGKTPRSTVFEAWGGGDGSAEWSQ